MESGAETVSLRAKKGKADGVQFRKPGYVAAASRSKTAQAVLKVISQARGHRAKVLMNYVGRTDAEKSLALEDENGLQVQGVDGIQTVYDDWKQDFERATPGQKRPPRHVTHMIFSGDCKQTPENARSVQSAVAELMREQLGRDGYRYLMVLHEDTDHPHVHVIVNNYNRDKDGPKLRINPPELLAFREQFAQKMRERGIEQQASRKRDRLTVLEATAKGLEELQTGGAWYERKLFVAAEANPIGLGSTDNLSAVEKPAAFDAFAKRRSMVKAVARIKADVKATTLPFSQARRERMAILRQIDQQLIDPAAPNYARLVENLTIKLDKDRERVKDHIRALSDPTNPVQDNKRRRQREQSIEKIITRNLEAVRSARLDLLRSPGVGVVAAYKLGYQLKTYERELLRIRTLHAFGAEQKAAPGTVAEVAAARSTAQLVARAERTADKLERLGPWHDPNPSQKKGRPFDAFAKRRALTNIATHLADSLDRAGVAPTDPLAARVDALRASLIDVPAPDCAGLVGTLQQRLQDTGQRAVFEARRAAHASTSPTDRGHILAKVRADLVARVASISNARREVAEMPGVADRERQTLAATLKRMERIATQAGRVVEKPVSLAAKLAELDKPRSTPAREKSLVSIPAKQKPTARSLNDGRDPYADYGLKGTPGTAWIEPKLYAHSDRTGTPSQSFDSLRTLSSSDLDGRDFRGAMLLSGNARHQLENEGTQRTGELRRPDIGLGEAGSGQGGRIEPVAKPGDRLTQEQLATLLDRVHSRLIEAGPWDDPTPFRSAHRAFYEGDDGREKSPVLDAFAKRRDMLLEIDKLKPEIDAARINFTPEMRRQLAAIREMREGIQSDPVRDMASLINRLAEKVTNDQLRIERQSDKPATSATELLQRRRLAERTATKSLQSIDDARREVQKDTSLKPMQRLALADRLKVMSKAIEIYSGKGLGR